MRGGSPGKRTTNTSPESTNFNSVASPENQDIIKILNNLVSKQEDMFRKFSEQSEKMEQFSQKQEE